MILKVGCFTSKISKAIQRTPIYSYCYDICDFLIFYQFYHQEPLSHGILQNLNLQTFRAWVADMAAPREYNNVYKKPLSARSRRRSISSLKSFLKFSSSKVEGYKFGYAEIQLLKNPKIPKSLPKPISEEQIDQLMGGARQNIEKKLGAKKKFGPSLFTLWLWIANS
jgi:site-specific recombinase XerD